MTPSRPCGSGSLHQCLAVAACGPRGPACRAVRAAGANVERVYYDVMGGSAGELLASLKEQGRTATQSDSNFARTTWTVTWTGEWAPAPGDTLCAVTSSSVGLESRMALPRWRPSPGAPSGLASDWASFVRRLVGHENGHLATAVAAARGWRAARAPARTAAGMMRRRRAQVDRGRELPPVRETTTVRTASCAAGRVWPPSTSPRLLIPGCRTPSRAPTPPPR